MESAQVNDKHRLGRRAEAEIAQRLISNGFKILARNYRCSTGEIDIVAESGDLVVFMEVRSESTGFYGDPAMTVTRPKQHRIASAAQHWLLAHPRPSSYLRFDVAGIQAMGGTWRVEIIEDAFTVPWAEP